jgi:hypothetical protein
MAVTTEWQDAAHSIIRMDFEGRWEFGDFFEQLEKARQMTESVPHRVDLILNHVGPHAIPRGNPWPLVRNYARLKPKNAGIIVHVNSSRFFGALNMLEHKLSPQSAELHRFVKSMDDALRLIAAVQRPTSEQQAIPVAAVEPPYERTG